MIKIYYPIALSFFCISKLFGAQPKYKVLAVALFNQGTVALGTTNSCLLIKNADKPKNEQILTELIDQPTYNLISNKEKRLLGAFCEKSFMVFNIDTEKTVWSRKISSSNCFAAFSHVDNTIFLCDNRHLITNKGISMPLPYRGTVTGSSLDCHPRKNRLLYPHSNKALTEYSFSDKIESSIVYHPKLEDKHTILSAFYSPEGNHIAILTTGGRILIYNTVSKSTLYLGNPNNQTIYKMCKHPIFFPGSNALICLIKNTEFAYLWEYTKNNFPVKQKFDDNKKNGNPIDRCNDVFVRKLDFSDTGTQVLVIRNYKPVFTRTDHKLVTSIINENIFLRYWLLKTYSDEHQFLPVEIIRLFMEQLKILYERVGKIH